MGAEAKEYPAVLSGSGDTDYARWMRTDDLLALQRTPAEMIHRDELLFQIVHQSTELWLKLAGAELAAAVDAVDAGRAATAARLVLRAAECARLVTTQLEMLRHLAPADFQRFRHVLGNGSGFESPGWKSVRQLSEQLGAAFDRLRAARGPADLVELYEGDPDDPLLRLAEAMIEWDERVGLWRTRHYKIAARVLGPGILGTKGTSVETLVRLAGHTFFPELWDVRTRLAVAAGGETGP